MRPARLRVAAAAFTARLLLWHTRRALQREPLQQLLQRPPLLRLRTSGQLGALLTQLDRLLKSDSNPCLPRSVILFQQLQALGEGPVLVMAAARSSLPGSGQLKAHAWLEIGGTPYAEARDFDPRQWLQTFRFPTMTTVTKPDHPVGLNDTRQP